MVLKGFLFLGAVGYVASMVIPLHAEKEFVINLQSSNSTLTIDNPFYSPSQPLTTASESTSEIIVKDCEHTDKKCLENLATVVATSQGIDPHLLHAVIEQESRWVVSAKSHKDAIGLMQVTWVVYSKICEKTKQDMTDPYQNLECGATYLKMMLDKYNGNLDKALSAYNAGETVVNKYKGVPPFRETKQYVKNIKQDYQSRL